MLNSIKRVIAIVLITTLFLQISLFVSADSKENRYNLYQNKSNLYTSTLVSNGDVDSAFDLVGNDVYVPSGTYIIKKPIILMGGSLIGSGMDKTIIVADFDDPNQPILLAGATCSIRNIQFRYKDDIITGKENQGQRVGIFTANYWPTEKGADFTNVKICNVGTGIWSPGSVEPSVINTDGAAAGQSHNATCFSATFENVVIQDFSYRGIDFNANARTGNIWRNVYISSGKFACDSAFYFSGEESECTIDLLTVADTRARKPIYLSGARAIDSTCINLKSIKLVDDNTTYIYFDKSSGNIKHLSFNNSTVKSGETLLQLGNTQFVGEGFETLNSIHIGTLTLSDIKDMTYASQFNYFKRKSGCTTRFYVTVDNYYYNAQKLEKEVYKAFPTSDENIIYTKKGQISTKGSTIMRPEYRLCPFYTMYEDTTLGKTLIWNGEAWQ